MKDLLAENRAVIDSNAFPVYNHIHITDIQPDSATAVLDIVPETLNSYGAAHGGAYFTLADTCAAFAARSDGRSYVTTSANSQFIRGVQAGRLTAKGTVLSRGRTMCVIEVRVTDERERLAYYGTFQYFCVEQNGR